LLKTISPKRRLHGYGAEIENKMQIFEIYIKIFHMGPKVDDSGE
jgi:hypothetical protein